MGRHQLTSECYNDQAATNVSEKSKKQHFIFFVYITWKQERLSVLLINDKIDVQICFFFPKKPLILGQFYTCSTLVCNHSFIFKQSENKLKVLLLS